MTETLALLCLFGILGSMDVVYFHLYKARLYGSRSSVREQWTHLVRLLLYTGMMSWTLFARASGPLGSGLAILVLLDLLNSLLDTYLEPESRKGMGGIPVLEHLLHACLLVLTGGILFSALRTAMALWALPNGLSFVLIEAPRWLSILGFQLGIGALFLFFLESILFGMKSR